MGLRQFIQRSARYSLRPQDKNVMRFSLQADGEKHGIHETTLLNLSETGAAFIVDSPYEPSIGDKIKVEIPIPGGDSLAWFGEVVRLQEVRPKRRFSKDDGFMETRKIMVGLRFETLPTGHTASLRRGLRDSFIQIMREQRTRNMQYYKTLVQRWAYLGSLLILAVLAAYFVYWLSQPDAHYDAKRGAPWGERFKFF